MITAPTGSDPSSCAETCKFNLKQQRFFKMKKAAEN